jgi:hypothetical protein
MTMLPRLRFIEAIKTNIDDPHAAARAIAEIITR